MPSAVASNLFDLSRRMTCQGFAALEVRSYSGLVAVSVHVESDRSCDQDTPLSVKLSNIFASRRSEMAPLRTNNCDYRHLSYLRGGLHSLSVSPAAAALQRGGGCKHCRNPAKPAAGSAKAESGHCSSAVSGCRSSLCSRRLLRHRPFGWAGIAPRGRIGGWVRSRCRIGDCQPRGRLASSFVVISASALTSSAGRVRLRGRKTGRAELMP